MRIQMTNHARERMRKYEISELWVKRAIAEPDSVIESGPNRKIAQKRLNGLVLRVIYETRDNHDMVTARPIKFFKNKTGKYVEKKDTTLTNQKKKTSYDY